MSTLTKLEIVEYLQRQTKTTTRQLKPFVDGVFDTLKETLVQGQPIKLSGFGTFDLRDKKPRIGRNPKTLEEAIITARRVVVFRASDKLKDKMEMVQNKESEQDGA